jgi:hypothetical protein
MYFKSFSFFSRLEFADPWYVFCLRHSFYFRHSIFIFAWVPEMSRQRTIALLSDNLELAETVQLDLEERGYSVIQLTGLKEDLKEIKDKEVDLLILDLDGPV